MDFLQIIANIAQIASVIWLLLFGSLTIVDVIKKVPKHLNIHFSYILNVILALIILVLSIITLHSTGSTNNKPSYTPITGISERIPTPTPTTVTLTPIPSPTTIPLMPTSTPILTSTSTPIPQKIITPTSTPTPTQPPRITISGIWKEKIITNGPINNLSLTQVGNSVTGQGTEAYPGRNYNVTINGSIDGIKVNITEYIDSSCSEQYSLSLNNNGLSMSGNKSGCNGNLENVTFTKS